MSALVSQQNVQDTGLKTDMLQVQILIWMLTFSSRVSEWWALCFVLWKKRSWCPVLRQKGKNSNVALAQIRRNSISIRNLTLESLARLCCCWFPPLENNLNYPMGIFYMLQRSNPVLQRAQHKLITVKPLIKRSSSCETTLTTYHPSIKTIFS